HMYALAVLGLLELGLGRPDQAARHLSEGARLEARYGITLPSVTQAAPDLIEALILSGARAEAAQALAELEERSETRWAQAAAARCRGLLVDDFEPEFEAALELYGPDLLFERARTQLCLGMRRRRSDAREPLNAALEYFEHAGADPWAERARAVG